MKSIIDIINQKSIQEADKNDLRIDTNNKDIIDALVNAFCEEMLAWYQYSIIAPFIKGNNMADVKEFYKEAAKDELEDHGYAILDRLHVLGADAVIDKINTPEAWNKIANHKYIVPISATSEDEIIESIEGNIEAERGAIETYTELEELTRDRDVITHEMVKHFLGDEQQHLQDLEDLLTEITSA